MQESERLKPDKGENKRKSQDMLHHKPGTHRGDREEREHSPIQNHLHVFHREKNAGDGG